MLFNIVRIIIIKEETFYALKTNRNKNYTGTPASDKIRFAVSDFFLKRIVLLKEANFLL